MRKAFTLIEAILALSISAVIMVGCGAMMFNMMAVVERLERDWTLKSHADGVERFLRGVITSSVILYPSRINDVFARYPSKNLAISKPPENDEFDDYCLTFSVNGEHPLFVSPTGFSPAKICWLVHENNEIYLIWRHANAEYENAYPAIYKTLLSPFVESVIYHYPDDTGWKEETEIDDSDTQKLPYYIRLIFSRGDEIAERVISLSGAIDPQLAQ